MKASAQHRFGRGALLALTALALSGCVTANTLEQAQTWTEYRNPKSRWPAPDPKAHLSQAAQLARLEQEGVLRLADYKDSAALETELTHLEAEGTIQRIEYKGQPAYYALVPFTVVADVALTPVYIVYAAAHLK